MQEKTDRRQTQVPSLRTAAHAATCAVGWEKATLERRLECELCRGQTLSATALGLRFVT